MKRSLALITLVLTLLMGGLAVAQDGQTGTIAAAEASVGMNTFNNGSIGIQVAGTWVATLNFEGTVDGTNWQALDAWPTNSATPVTSSTANGVWATAVGGVARVRVRASAYTSGTATISLRASLGSGKALAGTVTANAGTGTFTSAGNVAHDAVDSGNPVKVGFVARNADITPVANSDRVDASADLLGKLIALPYSNPENFVSGTTAAITGTTDTAIIAAQGASIRLYVTSLAVSNSHATVGTVVEFKDGTTVIWRGFVPAINSGIQISLPVPLRLTVNTAFNCANLTTGSNTFCSASGYKAAN